MIHEELAPKRYTVEVIENKVREYVKTHKKELWNDLVSAKEVGTYKEKKALEIYHLMTVLMNDEGYKKNEAWEIVIDRYLKV